MHSLSKSCPHLKSWIWFYVRLSQRSRRCLYKHLSQKFGEIARSTKECVVSSTASIADFTRDIYGDTSRHFLGVRTFSSSYFSVGWPELIVTILHMDTHNETPLPQAKGEFIIKWLTSRSWAAACFMVLRNIYIPRVLCVLCYRRTNYFLLAVHIFWTNSRS